MVIEATAKAIMEAFYRIGRRNLVLMAALLGEGPWEALLQQLEQMMQLFPLLQGVNLRFTLERISDDVLFFTVEVEDDSLGEWSLINKFRIDEAAVDAAAAQTAAFCGISFEAAKSLPWHSIQGNWDFMKEVKDELASVES